MSENNDKKPKRILSEEHKEKLAKAINDAVDVPMISEKTEGKIANKIVNIVFNALLDIIG